MLSVTVIIATTCEFSRKKSIYQAIQSVMQQNGVKIEIIVVVNGNRFNQELFDELKKQKSLHVVYQQKGNVSFARYKGVQIARNHFFCFLDDDDELLKDTLANRCTIMSKDKSIDVLVTNGIMSSTHDVKLVDEHLKKQINASISLSLLEKNWFASPAPLFRKSSVDLALFKIDLKFYELTYLFYKLIEKNYKIVFEDVLSYKVNVGTDASSSKSEEYFINHPKFLLKLMSLDLNADIKKKINNKILDSLNAVSFFYLSHNDISNAFKYHLKCLISGGWKYVFYTRKLIYYFFKNKF